MGFIADRRKKHYQEDYDNGLISKETYNEAKKEFTTVDTSRIEVTKPVNYDENDYPSNVVPGFVRKEDTDEYLYFMYEYPKHIDKKKKRCRGWKHWMNFLMEKGIISAKSFKKQKMKKARNKYEYLDHPEQWESIDEDPRYKKWPDDVLECSAAKIKIVIPDQYIDEYENSKKYDPSRKKYKMLAKQYGFPSHCFSRAAFMKMVNKRNRRYWMSNILLEQDSDKQIMAINSLPEYDREDMMEKIHNIDKAVEILEAKKIREKIAKGIYDPRMAADHYYNLSINRTGEYDKETDEPLTYWSYDDLLKGYTRFRDELLNGITFNPFREPERFEEVKDIMWENYQEMLKEEAAIKTPVYHKGKKRKKTKHKVKKANEAPFKFSQFMNYSAKDMVVSKKTEKKMKKALKKHKKKEVKMLFKNQNKLSQKDLGKKLKKAEQEVEAFIATLQKD